AGTQRLRDVINKGVTEDDLFAAAEAAFEEGWSSLKLYFMIGLPTEEMTDLDGIVALARRVADLGTAAARRGRFKKRVHVTVSVSNFVPKAHTPFQWEGQHPIEELKAKQEYLRQRLRDKRISYNWHEAELSFWEAVIARGDRRLGPALEKAWQKGCRFDGWSEYFQSVKWREAMAETGLNPEFYANRQIPLTDILPWDHLSSGVTRDYLADEYRAAMSGITTEDCRLAGCTTCGVCAALGVNLNLTSLGRDESGNVSVSDRI
ncbi:MAG: B12-binding domain-containing radical SAM protein, partial [Syntrophomonadaceae bacterium]|nr:B12-binding domain-containing radical SAM protein [Syntrophomonadaceae bacterium]